MKRIYQAGMLFVLIIIVMVYIVDLHERVAWGDIVDSLQKVELAYTE